MVHAIPLGVLGIPCQMRSAIGTRERNHDGYTHIGLGAFHYNGTTCTAAEFSISDAGYGTARPDGPAIQLVNVKTEDANEYAAHNFGDVDASGWCASQGWLRLALVNGYMEGYKNGDGTGYTHAFGPYENLTREQLAAMIGRLCVDYAGMADVARDDVTTRVAAFPDGASISSWAYDGVAFCAANGIITGYAQSGEFGPADNATREQMAKITVATALLG